MPWNADFSGFYSGGAGWRSLGFQSGSVLKMPPGLEKQVPILGVEIRLNPQATVPNPFGADKLWRIRILFKKHGVLAECENHLSGTCLCGIPILPHRGGIFVAKSVVMMIESHRDGMFVEKYPCYKYAAPTGLIRIPKRICYKISRPHGAQAVWHAFQHGNSDNISRRRVSQVWSFNDRLRAACLISSCLAGRLKIQ